jgi:hypothetical protein
MTSNTTGSKPPDNLTPQERAMPKVNKVTADDITASLKAGFSDFLARPVMSGFFGLFYAVFGILLVWTLVGLGKIWMIIPAVVAFPLVAPFAAAGLYEMSRRLQKGEDFGWAEILTVMANQRKREMGWMAFVTLFILWVWFYQFRTVLVIVLQAFILLGFGRVPEHRVLHAGGLDLSRYWHVRGRISVGRPVLGDRRRHAHAAGTGDRFRVRHDHVRSRRHGKPGGHAHLGGDHLGHHAVVAGASVSGPDLHPADPWPHHMASLSAGRGTRRMR